MRVLVALLFVVAAEALRGHRRQQPSQWQSDQHRRKARRRRQRRSSGAAVAATTSCLNIFRPRVVAAAHHLNASQLEILSYERRVAVFCRTACRERGQHPVESSSATQRFHFDVRALPRGGISSSTTTAQRDRHAVRVQEMNATCRTRDVAVESSLHALREWRHELFDRRRFVAIVKPHRSRLPSIFSYGLCVCGLLRTLSTTEASFTRTVTRAYARSDKFYAYFEDMWNQSTNLFSEWHISVKDRRTRQYRHFKEVAKGIEFRSCLPPSEYAPHPREQLLQQEQHCTMWSPNRRRSVDGSGKAGQRGIAHRERLRKYVQELQDDGIGSGEGSWWDADATESNEEEEEKEEKEEERNEEERGLTAGKAAEDLPLKNNDKMMNYIKRESTSARSSAS